MPDAKLRTLTSVYRLRKVETDEARRDLGDALATEAALADQHAAVQRELDVARQTTGDFDRDAFAVWWRRVRSEQARLAAALRQAETRTASAREALAHRRVAETAAEEALAQTKAAREADVARREQLMLEDVARALRQAATSRAAN